jgi:hypothetical protein
LVNIKKIQKLKRKTQISKYSKRILRVKTIYFIIQNQLKLKNLFYISQNYKYIHKQKEDQNQNFQTGTDQTPLKLQQKQRNNQMVLTLQAKVDSKLRDAIDMINYIIESTNSSITEYFSGKNQRLEKVYRKLLAEIEREKLSTNAQLEKMVDNSKDTISNLQQYFGVVMDSTLEKTFDDIKVCQQ